MRPSNFYASVSDYDFTFEVTISPAARVRLKYNAAQLQLFSRLSKEQMRKVGMHALDTKGKNDDYVFFFYRSKGGNPMMGINLPMAAEDIVKRSVIWRKLNAARHIARDLKRWIDRHE